MTNKNPKVCNDNAKDYDGIVINGTLDNNGYGSL